MAANQNRFFTIGNARRSAFAESPGARRPWYLATITRGSCYKKEFRYNSAWWPIFAGIFNLPQE